MNTPTALTCDPTVLDTLTPHQLFDEISQIRDQYVQEVPGKRRSWPASLRSRVEALARLGVPFSKIAAATGISRATIFLWCGEAGAAGKRASLRQRPGFVQIAMSPVVRQDARVAVAENPACGDKTGPGLKLRMPGGHEFSGIESVADLIVLYRALEQASA